MSHAATLNELVAEAVIGIDTLWGGDVMSPSGTGRFIADCWFSEQPLPYAYSHPAAAALRETGGVAATTPDLDAIDAYLAEIALPSTMAALANEAGQVGGLRGRYLEGLALCFEVMWDLAQEVLGRGPGVPYERCVHASTGQAPAPSRPEQLRALVRDLLAYQGLPVANDADLPQAVEQWRRRTPVAPEHIATLSRAIIADLDALTLRHVVPHLPRPLHDVPRANITFLPIDNAWFSGSMNYLGRARRPDGRPEYEATYEINASLHISRPELVQLVSHEVVPGHVTAFAYLQDLHERDVVGFEASVLTMNTRAATLFEGIANNALLMAHGVTSVDELPERDLRIGATLALLQDAAKNQASWLTWHERREEGEVAAELRRDYLVSEERARKLAGAWGRHPLMGRMYLPCYQAGTDTVARLRRKYPLERLLPALYGCHGVVDAVTIEDAI
jgi:hypothetical protein